MYFVIDNEVFQVTGVIKSHFSFDAKPKMKLLFILQKKGENYTMGWFQNNEYRLYGGKKKNYLYAKGRFDTDLRIG